MILQMVYVSFMTSLFFSIDHLIFQNISLAPDWNLMFPTVVSLLLGVES